MCKKLYVLLQYIIPQHTLSRLLGYVANCRCAWFKNLFIKWFIRHYKVDMSIAEKENPADYLTFNEFFIRRLKPAARPITRSSNSIICPADSVISQFGGIDSSTLIQAKNVDYSLSSLLTTEQYAQTFQNGEFATLYLSPKDYHRVHMPFTGKLLKMIYVPGKLFAVNPTTAERIPNLFAKNERVICIFETEIGKIAVIMIGAMIVASINVVWANKIVPNKEKSVQSWDYESTLVKLNRGDELGHFELGSTVIVLFEQNKIQWHKDIVTEQAIKFGEEIASIKIN